MADDELDRRIAEALASYPDGGPCPAPTYLAARVIATARERRPAPWWWTSAGLFSAMACLLLIMLVTRVHRRVAPPESENAASLQATKPRMPALPTLPKRPRQALYVRRHKQPAVAANLAGPPRLDQFPTPAPLTDEEKVMLAFVASASPATQQFVARAVQPPLPIRLAEEHFFEQPISADPGAPQTSTPSTSKAGASHEENR